MGKNIKYTYVPVNNKLFVNIEQNNIKLFFILYRKSKPFSLFDGSTAVPIIRLLPAFMVRAIRILEFIYYFYKMKRKYRLKKDFSIITTDHYGHCLLMLRQGEMKIFDLNKQHVITVFPDSIVIKDIRKRMEALIGSQQCKLAQKLIDWDINKRFIIESYINASSPWYKLTDLTAFYFDIIPILISIMATTKPKTVSLKTLSEDKLQVVERNLREIEKNQKFNNDDTAIIRWFLKYIKLSLNKAAYHKKIHLVYSHGDLWEGNILVKGKSHYVIDWNTLDYRSFYFDFYFSMFMLASKNNHFDTVDNNQLSKLNAELDTGCNVFNTKLEEYQKEVDWEEVTIPNQFAVYRYLFYLELIYLKLEAKSVYEMKQVGEIMTWVNRFKLFEKHRYGLESGHKYEG